MKERKFGRKTLEVFSEGLIQVPESVHSALFFSSSIFMVFSLLLAPFCPDSQTSPASDLHSNKTRCGVMGLCDVAVSPKVFYFSYTTANLFIT